MERQQIEVFLTLAEELHFGRTAERLRLSQARVSQSIKASETEIGCALFWRTSRRVELTAVGAQLLDELGPANARVLESVERAATAGRAAAGRLRVAFLGPLAGDLLALSAAPFRESRPGTEVELRATEIADPVAPLRDGDVDLLLTQLPVREPDLISEAGVIEERRVLAVASTHPLASRPSVTLEDLACGPIFRPSGTPSRDWEESYQPWTTPSGVPIARGPEVSTFGELLSMIAAGEGICTVAAHNELYHPRPGIEFIPIDDAPPFEFGFVWRAATETPLLRAFRAAVRREVEKMGGPAQVSGGSARARRGV